MTLSTASAQEESGSILLHVGTSSNAAGGHISLRAGASSDASGSGGSVEVAAGGGHAGGDVIVRGGLAESGKGGSIIIDGGGRGDPEIGGVVSLRTGASRDGNGGSLSICAANSTDSGPNVTVSAGVGGKSHGMVRVLSGSGSSSIRVDGTTVEMLAAEQSVTASQISLDASGAIGNTIEFSVSNRPGPDFRLESAGAGGSIISTVPMRVTKIEYSSDERIKEDIHYLDDAELDDIYDRFTQIKLANYRYTDEWLKIRGVDDVVVRGVIAQNVREVFPERVEVVDNYTHPAYNFSLDGFHQVDKQGLTLDLIAAMQSHNQ